MNILKNCLKNKSFIFALSIIIIFLLIMIFGFLAMPNDPYQISSYINKSPSFTYLFGTDKLGRCIFSRTLVAIRWLFYIGFCSSSISLIIGSIFGFMCYSKKLDAIIMFFVNILISIPDILLILSIISIFGTSTKVLIATIGFLGITPVIRTIRSNILEASSKDYVVFAKSLGVSNLRIITHHLIGEIVPALIVTVALRFTTSILVEAGIGYLGFSSSERISIGQMTYEFSNSIFTQTYKIIPAFLLMLIGFAFYKISDTILNEMDEHKR